MERKVHLVNKRPQKPKLLRVVGYARVSSGKDAMLHSLAAQVDYFQNLIKNTPGWQYCGVFSDEAMTGTKEDRPGFQKMIEKCRAGEVDLIICKSISRFARNTVTLLETVRELKLLGVDVFFEKENLHSTSGDGELMLSILASFAQEESKSVSDNMKWRIRKDLEQGKIGSITIFGYRRTANGSLEIHEKEAEIVRMIFSDYISGMGQCAIAKKINEMGIPTRQGNLWTGQRVKEILINEKYMGNMLLQKYYRENHITKRKMKNNGELRKFLVEESHEPIISPEIFEQVQRIVSERTESFGREGSTKSYSLTGMVECSCCGKNYQRKIYSQGAVWLCATYIRRGKKYCPDSKQISERILYEKICEILDIDDFDESVVKCTIEKIIAAPEQLTFLFKDGTQTTVNWENHSRSESWTPEMREKAREKSCRK